MGEWATGKAFFEAIGIQILVPLAFRGNRRRGSFCSREVPNDIGEWQTNINITGEHTKYNRRIDE